jgi:hypothetical protein
MELSQVADLSCSVCKKDGRDEKQKEDNPFQQIEISKWRCERSQPCPPRLSQSAMVHRNKDIHSDKPSPGGQSVEDRYRMGNACEKTRESINDSDVCQH